jgi:hypothetical protein
MGEKQFYVFQQLSADRLCDDDLEHTARLTA